MDKQIYSATYSNVPVFEFVTSEGPVMRRKLDSYINATHILKIAKFPKAKRTRILEKDVQTRTHDKVQGGYGKYQGTYVPLELGEEIARNFGIYDILRPIFEFKYIEGRSQTPPPAPKHSHASASNVARKQLAAGGGAVAPVSRTSSSTAASQNNAELARKTKSMSALPGEPPKKRGRPKRVTENYVPHLTRTDTAPIKVESGPSIGTFNNSRNNSILKSLQHPTQQLLSRQDTDQDALQLMVTSLNVQNEDLEIARSDDEGRRGGIRTTATVHHDTSLEDDDENDELMTGHELFGSPRNSFEKIVQTHNQQNNGVNYPFGVGLHQYHHSNNNGPTSDTTSVPTPISRGSGGVVTDIKKTNVYTDYFTNLLNYFLEDSNNNSRIRPGEKSHSVNAAVAAATAEAAGITTTSSTPNVNEVVHTIPAHILNPPQPYSKININQPVDNEGNSILHWACSMANINMIEFLLEIFKDYLSSTIKNHHGETPLMFATRFSNSFQLKNFSTLLDLLFDSILLIDNAGRTILHHIAISATVHERNGSSGSFVGDQGSQQYATYKKNKEKFARYYMETLFAKIIELQDYQENGHNKKSEHIKIQNNLVPTGAIKNELIAKVINHQDINGNTAFHIIAYNLNKKLIKVFIGYHKYIDFTLKNLVSYTVEEYLASHNFVLRLGNDIISQTVPEAGNSINRIKDSFENELFVSRNALNSFKSSTGALNEKFLELSYCIDKELSAKDGKLLLYYKVVKQAKLEKLYSQSDILKFFKLDHLIEDQINEVTKRPDEIEDEDETEEKRDNIIQDEIYRLVSDLSYEYLKKKEELNNKVLIYKKVSDVLVRKKLKELEKRFIGESEINNSAVDGDSNERFRLSIALQQNIIKRQNLMKRLIIEQLKVPISVNDKENVFDSTRNPTEPSSTPTMKSEATPLSTPRTTSLSTTTTTSSQSSILSRYPRDDKLNKYCKLISICCGMNFNDIEKLIDLIDQSLSDQQSLASATQPAAN